MTPEAFLSDFLDAFNNLETDRFLDMFAPDSTVFLPIRVRERLEGEEQAASWRALHDGFRSSLPGPPYLRLAAVGLKLQDLGDITLATFHLAGAAGELGRRTIVLRKRGEDWEIIHLHASTMPTLES